MYMRLVSLALLSVLGGFPGCGKGNGGPPYGMGFHNETTATITDTRVDWTSDRGAFNDGAGILAAGADGTTSSDPRPIPLKATVTWKTADGKPHSQVVEVANLIPEPAKFSGTIYFKFMSDGSVKVVPLTYTQIQNLAAHLQKYP